MPKFSPVMMKWLWLSALVIVIDQLTKWAITSNFSLYQTLDVVPYLNLTLAHNTGAAFSFLADAGGWQRWFFIGLTILVTLFLLFWLSRLNAKAKLEALAVSLIIGGALGNVIDRILYGYVIDFLDVYYGGYHWPAFNVADSAICLGAALLIIDSFRQNPEKV